MDASVPKNGNPPKDDVYFGGMPTDPDVRLLREEFPDASLTPGKIIPYSDVAALIGAEHRSSRFSTVTQRWRRLVEDENAHIVIGTETGIGFKVLSPGEKIDLAGAKLRQAARASRRSYVVTTKVETGRLSDEDKDRLGRLQARSAAIIAAGQVKSRAGLPDIEGGSVKS